MRRYQLTLFALTITMLGQISIAQAQTSQRTAAVAYFGRGLSQQSFTRATTRAQRPQQNPQTNQAGASKKPFENIVHQPTISPYLSLDIATTDGGAGLPNYYAFYKPQREQQQLVESQRAEIRKLQQHVSVAGANDRLARNPTQGMPTTGNSSQFMNLGNYYPGLR